MVLTSTFPRWKDDIEPPFVFELCRALHDFDIHVIAPHAEGSLSEELMDGIHVYRFHYAPEKLEKLAYNGGISSNLKTSPWKYFLIQGFLLSQFFLAYRIAKKHDIHLIHAHWMIPTGLIGASLRELLPGENRLVVTAHGGDVHGLKGKIFSALRRWVAKEADCVSVVSQNLKQKALNEAWPAKHLALAPMGVDLQQNFIPKLRNQTKPTVVFAGRLVSKKGVSHLISAMHEVIKHLPNCQLLIAGHGPLRQQLQQQTEELGLSQHVSFLGPYTITELPSILQRGNIAAFPFDTAVSGDEEGLGLTTIEAMGCGIPVIVGNVPAIHDVVIDEETGLIVDPKDYKKFSQQIVALLQDPEKQKRLVDNAHRFASSHFDWKVSANTYEIIFNRILPP